MTETSGSQSKYPPSVHTGLSDVLYHSLCLIDTYRGGCPRSGSFLPKRCSWFTSSVWRLQRLLSAVTPPITVQVCGHTCTRLHTDTDTHERVCTHAHTPATAAL
ncbi:unnamed protein product [Boreogadus saida]